MFNMNKNRATTSFFTLLILVLISTGCKKHEGIYYDYINPNAKFNGTSLQFLESQKGIYDSMVYVLSKVRLSDIISNGQNTVFAVPNQSFTLALDNLNNLRQLQRKEPIYLAQADSTELDTLLRRYILPEIISTDSIKGFYDGKWFPSLDSYEMQLKYVRQSSSGYVNGGPQLIIFSDPKNSQFERYWVKSNTASVNIYTSNGILHILDASHEFGFGEVPQRFNK